jgi:hypothetical protein
MFRCRSEPTGPKTVNAIHPTAALNQAPEPLDREMEMLWRLAELSMELAELTAREIREEAASQPEQPKVDRPRRADPRLIYTRLERAVRDTIALIRRLAAGLLPKAPRSPREIAPHPTPKPAAMEAPKPPEDPRRFPILHYFRQAIDINAKRRKIPITHQDIENRVDSELANDPDHRHQGRDILLKICKSLDLPFYANRMHPDLYRQSPAPIQSAA